jgi:hypothetical protein
MQLKAEYKCRCVTPRLQRHLKEDTGLCESCGFVYDENLYWMRIRQHVPNVTAKDLDEFLTQEDPNYAALNPT